MRFRIRSQLLLPVTLLLVGVAGISILTAVVSARQARMQIEVRLREAARFLAEDSTFPLPSEVLRQLQPLSGAHYLLVTVEERSSSLATDPGRLDMPIADDWQALHLDTLIKLDGANYLGGALRVRRRPYTGGVLYIFYPESLLLDARRQAIWPSLLLGTTVGLIAVGVALAQAHRLGRRIQELGRRTCLIAAGDFSPMPLPGRDDEIRDLTQSVNEMAEQLARFQQSMQQTERLRILGQVSGGLAHQLRNGLTGARLAVQLYLTEAGPEQDVTALEVALRQLTLLETHVKRFLDLGRAGLSRREQCDLAALIQDAVDLLRPQCKHAGIDLVWNQPGAPFPLVGDSGQLTQVLVNLLGNAIEAAGPGGRVEIGIESAGNLNPIRVFIIDSGSGPGPDVASRLFEPFVTSKPEGVGLGLAVARQVIEGHGGKIGWERMGETTCFSFELPPEQSSMGPQRKPDGGK